MADLLEVRVKAVAYEADGILSYDLRPAGSGSAPAFTGGALPAFTAGAHIDLHIAWDWCAAIPSATRRMSGTAT